MRRFAWYGRLSTKDKQDPTLSFPSQREACATKATELGGEIVCEFTDQEAVATEPCCCCCAATAEPLQHGNARRSLRPYTAAANTLLPNRCPRN